MGEGGSEEGHFPTFYLFIFLASKWSKTSRNAKKFLEFSNFVLMIPSLISCEFDCYKLSWLNGYAFWFLPLRKIITNHKSTKKILGCINLALFVGLDRNYLRYKNFTILTPMEGSSIISALKECFSSSSSFLSFILASLWASDLNFKYWITSSYRNMEMRIEN